MGRAEPNSVLTIFWLTKRNLAMMKRQSWHASTVLVNCQKLQAEAALWAYRMGTAETLVLVLGRLSFRYHARYGQD